MLISIAFIAALTLGGMSLTYLVARERSVMWRLAAGNIVGCALFGTIAFVVACTAGFNPASIIATCVLTLLATLVFIDPSRRTRLKGEWNEAKAKLEGVNADRLRGFAYYSFFFLLFWFFFSQAMYERPDGIYTGGSNNLGDLPYHLGAILGFTEGNNFPPENPSWAGARFSYPFIADFLTACFVKLGADIPNAMFVQNLSWAMSLLVILERFARTLTGSKLAGRIAPALLIFAGGLGFVWFGHDWWKGSTGLWDILWHLPQDYTINNDFRWGNSMVVLFITQRSLLLGMPLTVLVLGWLWRVFAGESPGVKESKTPRDISTSPIAAVLVGLLAGSLVLIHLHSLAVLFVVAAFVLIVHPAQWKPLSIFAAAVAVIAIPELLWSMSGSANQADKFLGLSWGWVKEKDEGYLWFWLRNTGITIPMILGGLYLLFFRSRRVDKSSSIISTIRSPLLLFYIPFAFLFVQGNILKVAPWEWDNIKLLIYWFVGSTPFIGYAIAWLWEQGKLLSAAAIVCFMVLTFAGALDVWRTASGQIKIRVFDKDAVQVAEQIKLSTEPRSLFLNAPTYNSAVVLSGRPSLMRYSGHLSSHGIDYGPREDDVKRIYLGGGVADILLRKYGIDNVLISPEELDKLHANEEYFKKYPVIAEAGPYRVYKVK